MELYGGHISISTAQSEGIYDYQITEENDLTNIRLTNWVIPKTVNNNIAYTDKHIWIMDRATSEGHELRFYSTLYPFGENLINHVEYAF